MIKFCDEVDQQCWHMVKCVIKNAARLSGEDDVYLFDMMGAACEDKVKNYLDTIPNLYCVGRNGQHRYNNMDHSILTGIEAAKAFISGSGKEQVWNVNTENEYHEKK